VLTQGKGGRGLLLLEVVLTLRILNYPDREARLGVVLDHDSPL